MPTSLSERKGVPSKHLTKILVTKSRSFITLSRVGGGKAKAFDLMPTRNLNSFLLSTQELDINFLKEKPPIQSNPIMG
jgi:hypothetical protein